jgi:FtsH-binding integral membrane protein
VEDTSRPSTTAGLQRQGSSRDKYASNSRTFNGSTSHFFVSTDQYYAGPSSTTALRHAFMRKVYGILTVQLLVTVAIACWCMFDVGMRTFCIEHKTALYFGLLIPLFISLCILSKVKNKYPKNYFALLFFTVVESFVLGIICALHYDNGRGAIILQTFGITMAVFLLLSLYTCPFK